MFQEDLIIPSTVILPLQTSDYSANTILAGGENRIFDIWSRGKVNFSAGNKITLSTGFKARNGCYFKANIKGYSANNILSKTSKVASNRYHTLKSNLGFDAMQTQAIEKPLPKEYSLSQSYPNPFNPATRINYELPKQTLVTLRVYDILGKQVAELVNQNQEAGYYNVTFDGSNLSSGIYIYLLKAGEFTSAKKFILMK